MNEPGKHQEDGKVRITTRIAKMSQLLSMVPSKDGDTLKEPLTGAEMSLPEWLDAARKSFLELSLLISRELDIDLQ